MKKILFIAVLGFLFGIGLYLALPYMHKTTPMQMQSSATYYCPMHPTYISDHPGDCPICHMNLVKKDEPHKDVSPSKNAIAGHKDIMLSDHQKQMMGVKTMAVERKPLVKTVHAYGYVAHDLELYEAQLEYIDAWRIYFAFQSRRPIKDEFRTDWRDYYLQETTDKKWRSDEKIKAQERLIKAEYELIHMGLTENQIAQLREVKYGEPWVQPDLLFFEKNQPVWIYAQIFETDLGFVDIGQKAIVRIPAYGETTEGVVKSVAPIVDPETRSARVRIEMPKYRSQLSVNMYTEVDFPVELNAAVLVPTTAIMATGTRKIVFVESHAGHFEPRQIKTGFEGDGMVMVLEGLNEGEKIAVAGNFLIDSESRLQAALTTSDESAGGHIHGQ